MALLAVLTQYSSILAFIRCSDRIKRWVRRVEGVKALTDRLTLCPQHALLTRHHVASHDINMKTLERCKMSLHIAPHRTTTPTRFPTHPVCSMLPADVSHRAETDSIPLVCAGAAARTRGQEPRDAADGRLPHDIHGQVSLPSLSSLSCPVLPLLSSLSCLIHCNGRILRIMNAH